MGGTLALAMSFGLFTGMGMDAKAAEEYEIVPIEEPASYDEMKALCDFDDADNKSGERETYIRSKGSQLAAEASNGKVIVILDFSSGYTPQVNILKYTTSTGWGTACTYNDAHYEGFFKDFGYKWYCLKKKGTTPPSGSSTSTSEDSSGSAVPPVTDNISPAIPMVSCVSHTHSYSWVTVQEAAVGQDGIEEYRCSCGDVQGRNVIPASAAFVDGFYDEIVNAPQNGTTTFDSGWLCTFSDDMIKKLAERTDVTTVITFEYQKQSYRMTIPAGADFASLLADEERFYGYFYFANVVGATIEAL